MHRIARTASAVALLLLTSTIGLALMLGTSRADAQTPTASPTPPSPRVPFTDAQELAVERQLLCPLCVNERLDVCTLAICNDMKQQVRDQLGAGRSPDDIILFFSTRYGPKIRADLPREGFNLILFGWVGGAIALTALAGGYALYAMRRDSRQRRLAVTSGAPGAMSDGWVDDLVDEARSDDPPTGAR
ncbi:MAG: cytochrome c-type biogenesis protein CcmH [Chloroflexota bacterium]